MPKKSKTTQLNNKLIYWILGIIVLLILFMVLMTLPKENPTEDNKLDEEGFASLISDGSLETDENNCFENCFDRYTQCISDCKDNLCIQICQENRNQCLKTCADE